VTRPTTTRHHAFVLLQSKAALVFLYSSSRIITGFVPRLKLRGFLAHITRRKFLQGAAAAATAGILAVGADGLVFEPGHPQLNRITVPLARLPQAFDGFTIAQLSDFHYDEHFSAVAIRKSVDIINSLNPDLVVLTGDFVTVPLFTRGRNARLAAESVGPCALLLHQLRSKSGSFAVLGNHDVGSDSIWITETIERQGIPVLRNYSVPLDRDGARIWLAGIDDALEGKADIRSTLRLVPDKEFVMLLAHEPDFASLASRHSVDLQLSGHSHGGQVWLPFVGAPWLPPMGRKYPRGMYRIGELTLYTNIGVGTIRVPVRLNCPPEVTLFTLRSAPQS
jgi:predicted MPP superfamily phosphohydrolase